MRPGDLERELAAGLAERDAAGLLRRTDERAPAGADFTSNDTLGLAHHPAVVAAAHEALERFGAGARSARLLGGAAEPARAAERAAAAWLGAADALLFASGWQANVGVVGALAGRGDAVLSDARNHASLIDAARLSRARVVVCAHADVDAFERALVAARGARRRLVVTESVFSMDGDLAPLAELHELCARHDAWLVVDEAHAAGLLGVEGRGGCEASGVAGGERLAARVVTGGKALGVAGAFALGGPALREHLANHARTFVYATAPPPAVAAALAAAVEVARGADRERELALGGAARLAAALDLPAPAAAIVPVPAASVAHAVGLAEALAAAGLHVRAIRPPTAPTPRLRVVVHATNTDAELSRLIDVVRSQPPQRADPADVRRARARAVFVAGTDTGVGKTVVAALLVAAARRGAGGGYWKPVQTGEESDTAEVARLAGVAPDEVRPPRHAFPLPASPHHAAAAAGSAVDVDGLRADLARHRAELARGTLIVELAGGLLVPLTDDVDQADWLAREGAPVVLAARSGLGTLNHTRLSFEALRARGLEPRALFLVGEPHAPNRATLERLGVPIFEVPLLAPLDAAALGRWLDAHDLGSLLA